MSELSEEEDSVLNFVKQAKLAHQNKTKKKAVVIPFSKEESMRRDLDSILEEQ